MLAEAEVFDYGRSLVAFRRIARRCALGDAAADDTEVSELHARLHYGRTDELIRFGLHEYLIDFLERIAGLGAEISRVFLVPTY